MKFELFSRLYDEAKNYDNDEMYIAERGWQDWMDQFNEDNIGNILTEIYKLAKMDFASLLKYSGMTVVKFRAVYGLPERTVFSWKSGDREITDYLLKLIAYTLYIDRT